MAFTGPVVIIGGGIGGMSLAAALHLVGIRADVFEQAPAIREVGAGVGLWPNGLASLDQIGAGDAVRASCRPLRRGEMVNPRGQVLQSYDIDALGGAFGGAALRVVHRADLLAAIHARVPAERVHVGRRCVGVDGGEGAALARFEDGSTAEGALLVGADGLRSVARRAVLGDDPIRYSGQTCFRGIAALRVEDPGAIREIQGPGQRCAVCPITDELVYWWAAYNAPEGAIVPEGRRRAHLRERYRGWPFGFEALLEATPEEAFLQNDLLDRAPVKRWSRGRLALLGDAAHPTTPNLGQGANMAIDDAIVLARELARGDDPVAAVNRYEAARVARTSMIVRRSWTFGQLCRWERAPLVWLRELLVKGAPERWMRAEIERQILESVGPLRPGGTGA